MRTSRTLACLALACLSSACAVGPDYRRPDSGVPAGYRGQAEPIAQPSIADLPWWELYRDPQLTELIRTALAQNIDLQVAVARVEEARARARGANADFFPTVEGTLSTSAQPSGSSYAGGASLSWELDFFGRVRRSSQAARADLLASEEGRRAAVVSLVSQVATSWFQLRSLDEQREITLGTIQSNGASLKLVETQKRGGVASGTEVQQARGQLATVRAQLPLLEEQIAQGENLLSVLLGRNPGPIDRPEVVADPAVPPQIPAGLPSDLLERRPDIRQAEQRLAAATARIGVAKAQAFPFPRILLTALSGALSSSLTDLLRGDGAGISSLGPGVNWPLLDLKGAASVGVAKAQAEQAALTYRGTILTALREVADALVTCEKVQARLADEEVRVESGTEYLRLTNLRYRGGVADYLEVLDAERQLYSAQIDLSQAKLTKLLAVVQLYKALGGGWEQPPEASPPLP